MGEQKRKKKKKEEDVDDIDALFGGMSYDSPSQKKKKSQSKNRSVTGTPMQLKKPETKPERGSLDDFLNSFVDDLDKSKSETPTSKVITKKKKKKKKSTSKPKKEAKSAKKDNNDDFFDDW